jgi:hypothetical protein
LNLSARLNNDRRIFDDATAKQNINVSSAVRRYQSSSIPLTGPMRSASAFCSWANAGGGGNGSQAGQKKPSSAHTNLLSGPSSQASRTSASVKTGLERRAVSARRL